MANLEYRLDPLVKPEDDKGAAEGDTRLLLALIDFLVGSEEEGLL